MNTPNLNKSGSKYEFAVISAYIVLQNFSVSQILREIKFAESRVSDCAIFTFIFRDSEFKVLCIFALFEG